MSKKNNSPSLDWFNEIDPDAKPEFPPLFVPKVGKVYLITFNEDCPRVVPDKFSKTGVIEINIDGENYSLFLGHAYLRQKIYALQKKNTTLKGLKISFEQLKKRKNYIEYKIHEI
jgi:hypothetical protein